MKLAVLAVAAVLAPAAAPPAMPQAVRYLDARQAPSGGYAEDGSSPSPSLTAWVLLALEAVNAPVDDAARDYLLAREPELAAATDIALVQLALAATGARGHDPSARLLALMRPDGSIGPTVNSTIWAVIALRQAGERVPRETVRYLLARQTRAGGWSWAAGVAADSNDTAAAIQALRAAGVAGAPVRRGLAFLRRHQNADGGFALSAGRGSDAQSTAWAIQAFVAAGTPPGRRAFAYLDSLRRPDGSYRYSRRYGVTPAWVTAQVLPALARRRFPLD